MVPVEFSLIAKINGLSALKNILGGSSRCIADVVFIITAVTAAASAPFSFTSIAAFCNTLLISRGSLFLVIPEKSPLLNADFIPRFSKDGIKS